MGLSKVLGKPNNSYINDYYIQRPTDMTPGNPKELQRERRAQGNLMRVRSVLYNFGEVFGRGCFLVMETYK